MRMRRALFQLGHDQPILGCIAATDDHAGLLSLADATLGASRMQVLPHLGFSDVGRHFVRRVVRGPVITGRRREFPSRLYFHSTNAATEGAFPHRGAQCVRSGGIGQPVVRLRS